MKEFINVHCHLLNFKFVPDSFFKTRAGVREKLLRCKLTHHLARCLIFIFNLFRGPDKRYDKLHQVLAILNKDIHEVAKIFVDETKMKELEEAEIVLSTPLMMDLEIASLKMKPECPYRYQVKLISDIAIKYPGKIMPFIMVDPRRRLATELIVRALEEMGFLGVKMYPPLGYHPDPSSICNDDEINHELEKIYKYCEKNSIPITTHCSKGGAYSAELMRCMESVLEFCKPSSWEGVLEKYPKLYLNFAHFGGCGDFLSIDKPESWTNFILKLMREYRNVYADVSYHNRALMRKTANDYFKILNKLMEDDTISKRIIFGTDWLMTRHTWTEEQYIKAFINLQDDKLQQIAFQNPLNFLFPRRKLPKRIKQFFKSNNLAFPKWMVNNLEI